MASKKTPELLNTLVKLMLSVDENDQTEVRHKKTDVQPAVYFGEYTDTKVFESKQRSY